MKTTIDHKSLSPIDTSRRRRIEIGTCYLIKHILLIFISSSFLTRDLTRRESIGHFLLSHLLFIRITYTLSWIIFRCSTPWIFIVKCLSTARANERETENWPWVKPISEHIDERIKLPSVPKKIFVSLNVKTIEFLLVLF